VVSISATKFFLRLVIIVIRNVRVQIHAFKYSARAEFEIDFGPADPGSDRELVEMMLFDGQTLSTGVHLKCKIVCNEMYDAIKREYGFETLVTLL